MSLKIFTRDSSNQRKPGTWKGLITPNGRKATIMCPDCGGFGTLSEHEIAPDGAVSPSVVCPYEGCSFHEFIKLEGWKME